MELINKIVGLLVAVFAASLVAITVGYVAHYDFGLVSISDVSLDGRRHLCPANGASLVRKEAQMTQVS
jgi:hypothetical protein